MINHSSQYLREAYYHLVEVKPQSNVLGYRLWAIRRLFKIATGNIDKLENFLLNFDLYIKNKYGTFFLPKKSDFVFTVSSIVEDNLLAFFTLPSEGIFLDIGANAGKYSVIVAGKYPSAKVISFEPSPYTINILRKNISANDLSERVSVMNIGLSDKEGELMFAYSSVFTGVSHVVDTNTGQYDRFNYNQIPVPVQTLDSIVKSKYISPNLIFLIKIDVEGHELNVLNGAAETLSAMPKKSKIIAEIHPDINRKTHVIELLSGYGFKHEQIDEENFVFRKE